MRFKFLLVLHHNKHRFGWGSEASFLHKLQYPVGEIRRKIGFKTEASFAGLQAK